MMSLAKKKSHVNASKIKMTMLMQGYVGNILNWFKEISKILNNS